MCQKERARLTQIAVLIFDVVQGFFRRTDKQTEVKSIIINASLIDNIVQGEPEIQCGQRSVSFRLLTARPFEGRLFVDGESGHSTCWRRFSGDPKERLHASGYTGESPLDPILFEIAFGDCNMRRQRTLNPRGVEYSFTLIVSFHPLFVTKSDRAYRVRCFYTEAVKAIDTEIHVSQLTTRLVEREFPLPSCDYNLKRGVDGPLVRFANVGDRVTHVWQCDPIAEFIYGMLIHSCYVDDGNGNNVQLVDDRGYSSRYSRKETFSCGNDRDLLSGIRYNEHLLTAYADTVVFKYADRIQLYFTCTVQLCFRGDGGCDGITPPSCGIEDIIIEPSPDILSPPAFHHGDSHHQPDVPAEIAAHLSKKSFFGPIESLLPKHESFVPFRSPYKDSPLEVGNGTESFNGSESTTLHRAKRSPIEMDLAMDVFVLPIEASNVLSTSGEENGSKTVSTLCLRMGEAVFLLMSLVLFCVFSCLLTALAIRNYCTTKRCHPSFHFK